MPIIFKEIQPKKFKSDAIYKALLEATRKTAANVVKDYAEGVKTWDHKVKFRVRAKVNPKGGASIEVDTDDEIYAYVHEGTRPHVIKPKRAKALRFQSGHTAKTRPGVIKSGSGGSFGPTVFSRRVMHPGTKARRFSVPIRKKWQPLFARRMQRALEKGAKGTGHSL